MNNKVSIFVSGCDKYSACWYPFCHGIKKYWPDCPWPIYFVSNFLDTPCGKSIKVGKDLNWTDTQKKALSKIPSEVILFMLDDLWIESKVDTISLMEFADLIIEDKVDKIHLTNFPDEKKSVGKTSKIDKRLREYKLKSKYRTCLQGGLWRKSSFLSLMKDGETPWDFEVKGTIRSRSMPIRFLNVKKHRYLSYARSGAIEKGKWTENARKYIIKEGISVKLNGKI